MKSGAKILFLGPSDSPLAQFLKSKLEDVTTISEKIAAADVKDFEYLISYGYRHIVSSEVLIHFPRNKRINLHISLLPWNRGADPNLWSFVDATPQGVTIHVLEKGLDKGDILLQRTVRIDEKGTLASSYDFLQKEIQTLFIENWEKLKACEVEARKQETGGSYHNRTDKEIIWSHLSKGWDTPIEEVRRIGRGIKENKI